MCTHTVSMKLVNTKVWLFCSYYSVVAVVFGMTEINNQKKQHNTTAEPSTAHYTILNTKYRYTEYAIQKLYVLIGV